MDQNELVKLKKGKNKEQQTVLDYFFLEGCFAKKMKDEEYEAMIRAKRDSLNLRAKALSKIGLDEDELKEIPPAKLEGYVFEKAWAKQSTNGKWVSSSYQVAWVFFSATQVYIYRCTFCMDEDKKSEFTDEFFYKDVTSVSTSAEHETIKNPSASGGEVEVETHKFVMVVPGDKLRVSLDGVKNADEIIQAMKQKLREKKQI